MAGSDVAVSLRGLTKSYGGLVAVNDLSLDVLRGEVFGFLGPNGAGKTTTISMICGLLKIDSGEVLLNGRRVASDFRDHKRMIGLCPQELVIWESLTCQEQIEFVGCVYDVPRREARRRSRDLLDRLGLTERAHHLAKTLSGGMKRRLNIALALVQEPEILILDEPQAGLDPQSRILVREFIKSLARKSTVILTTHEMDEADRLADRIAIIDHGKLLVLDTSENLKNHIGEGDILEVQLSRDAPELVAWLRTELAEEVKRVTCQNGALRLVGTDLLRVLPLLMERLRSSEIQVVDYAVRKKTLEDVFIALTGRRLRE
ncbi:MAG: ABC transporter ATP-binding protein [Acidobacteriota bacterium]